MEIFNGLQYYNIGHLIYDLWLIIDVLFWCTLISIIIIKADSLPNNISWNTIANKQLVFLLLAILILINISSYPIKAVIIVVVFIILYFLKQNRATYLTIGICLLLGFGLTLTPLLLAVFYLLFQYFRNKINLAKK